MEYKLIRSKRKTVAIEIKEDKVIVKCPYRCSIEYIDRLIEKNREWIEETLKKVAERKENKLQFVSGETIFFMGREHNVKVNSGLKNSLIFNGEELIFTFIETVISKDKDRMDTAEGMLLQYFRNQAAEYLSKRTFELADQLGVLINKVSVKNVRTIWGSCSSKNNINYNIRLLTMPKEIIDYVVIHELCHTIERNHSKKFWELVQQILPDYKERRYFLNSNSKKYCNW